MRRDALPPFAVWPEGGEADGLACVDHPLVDTWERRLRSRPATERRLERATPQLRRLEDVFTAAGVPRGLALLAVVDDHTSKRIGLVAGADGAELERTARGAALYLHALRRRYGDWPLALAAWDAGVTRVDRALAREPQSSFWALARRKQLPATSRDFVPRLLATARLAENTQTCRRAPVNGPLPVVAALPPLPGPPQARGRGLSLRRQLTPQSALALSAGSDHQKDAPPDLRVTLGFQYSF